MNKEIKGLVVPVLTPFSEDWKIDEASFIRHLEFLSGHGVQRIMVNGTTAEFFSLLPEERKHLFKTARRYFKGQVILHAGGLALEQKKVEVQWANDFGADAVAVLPPAYPAECPEGGVIRYFQALEAVAEVPFLLYNFPKHSGNPITAKILQEVPHYGLKDSGGQLELMEHTPRYFAGSSSNIFEPVQQGAAGFVAGTANVRPELYAAFEMLLVDAKIEEAAVMQQEVKAYSARFSGGGIPMLKESLARKLDGYPTRVRVPLM